MNVFSNILLAEDDFTDYKFFAEAFEKISGSFKITLAKNGVDCMNVLRTGTKPDLIFLDLNMPGYNGLDCLKYIKSKENLAEIPVIIYSTSHYIKHIDECYKNEAHFYIVKPAVADHLVSVLQHVISNLQESLKRRGKEEFVLRVGADIES